MLDLFIVLLGISETNILYATPQIDGYSSGSCWLISEALLDFTGRRVVSSDDVDDIQVVNTGLCRYLSVAITVSILF